MKGLDSLLDTKIKATPKPAVILVHCGSNDLTLDGVTGKDLAEQMKSSFLRYQAMFSGSLIIWSAMLQRRYWHYAPVNAGPAMETKRKGVNRQVKKFVVENGGKYISNDCCINVNEISLFRSDGTHLSETGLEILFNHWKAAIEVLVFNDEQKIFPVPEPVEKLP